MEKGLLNPAQAAKLLNISPRTLEGWRRKGVGPPYIAYSARCVRYSEQALRQWLDSRARSKAPGAEHGESFE